MENIKYMFKVKEFLDTITELIEVCVDHSLTTATKDYLVFEVEYDNDEGVGKLKIDWGYEVGGFTDEVLVSNLKEAYNDLVKYFGEDIDFSDILNYEIK